MKSTVLNKRKAFEDLNAEIWVPIFRDYLISNMGRVSSSKGRTIQLLKTYPNNRGYHLFHPRINNKRIAYTIHRLVAQIFLKNIDPSKKTVNHHFGKDDNRATSLSWMTQVENTNHALATGLIRRGTDRPLATLDNTQVLTIRSLRDQIRHWRIAEYFKISRGTLDSIFSRKSWNHI